VLLKRLVADPSSCAWLIYLLLRKMDVSRALCPLPSADRPRRRRDVSTALLCATQRHPSAMNGRLRTGPIQARGRRSVHTRRRVKRKSGQDPYAHARFLCAGVTLLSMCLVSQWVAVGTTCAATKADSPARIGISVQPPVMWIPDVIPGHEALLPAPITVKNGGTGPITLRVEPIPASSLGVKSPPGYTDIPNPSWCRLDRDVLTLAAGEAKSVIVRLLVPDDPCHYNCHWCVAFSVRAAGDGTFGAAVYPYVYVDTASSADPIRPPKAPGDARALSPESPRGTDAVSRELSSTTGRKSGARGCLIVTPGVLDAGDVPIATTVKAGSISIRNSYDRDILLKVRPLVPEPKRSARRALITPGHMWMRNADWVQPGTRGLLIPAGKEARFDVNIAGPSDSGTINYRWEGFIAISGSNGSQSLVRVRWRTTDNPATGELTSRRRPQGDTP
jgi:hypothetical protein